MPTKQNKSEFPSSFQCMLTKAWTRIQNLRKSRGKLCRTSFLSSSIRKPYFSALTPFFSSYNQRIESSAFPDLSLVWFEVRFITHLSATIDPQPESWAWVQTRLGPAGNLSAPFTQYSAPVLELWWTQPEIHACNQTQAEISFAWVSVSGKKVPTFLPVFTLTRQWDVWLSPCISSLAFQDIWSASFSWNL